MGQRWRVLGLLFAVRTAMAFQFQSVAALAPELRRDLGLDTADLGLLIGIYMAPGLALALPGGAVGRRFGDKATVVAGLALMTAGGVVMAFASSWGFQISGRLLAGAGGVLLNVLMSKIVTDWFAGREIATAMGIFVNSWPLGIALALVLLPPLGEAVTLRGAFLTATAPAAAGLLAFTVLYRAPPVRGDAAPAPAFPPPLALGAVIVAGLIWGLYNAAIAMVFSFGPAFFVDRGSTAGEAGRLTSIVLWLTVLSVPGGGILADRSGRPRVVLVAGLLAFAAALAVLPWAAAAAPILIGLGLVAGLAAGPIMSLPAGVLAPPTRALGMGVFYLIYYAVIVVTPWAAGLAARGAETVAITLQLGTLFLVLAAVALPVFDRLRARHDGSERQGLG